MKRSQQKGFTLLELMVAISVSALLLGVLYQGLNQSLQQWQQNQRISDQQQQRYRLLQHLRQQLTQALSGEHKGEALFRGDQQQLSFISPVQHPTRSGLYHYQLRATAEPPYRLSLQISRWPHSTTGDYFVLYEGIAPLQLHYGTLTLDGEQQWQPQWQQSKLPQFLQLVSQSAPHQWVNQHIELRNRHVPL